MFKNLEKLVLTDCFFIEGLNKDAHFKKQGQFYNFSMKPYVPNTIKKLELRDCGLDTAHFKQIANLFPCLEELIIDFTTRYEQEDYAFDSDLMKFDLEIISRMKNLHTLKLLDLYEPAKDDWKTIEILECTMSVIESDFSIDTEVLITVAAPRATIAG